MSLPPDYDSLSIADLSDFCRIVEALQDRKESSPTFTTFKAVEARLGTEADAGRGRPIGNVSDRLQKISQKLYGKGQVQLIVARRGRGAVRISEEGQRLYRFARIVLRTMKRFRNDAAVDVDRTLTIYSAAAFATHILPILLRDYLRRSYFREIWLYEHTQVADILDGVACGQADLGICIDWPDPSLNKTELLRAGRAILAGVGYLGGRPVLSPDMLAKEVLITYQPNTLRRLKIQDAFPEPNEVGVRIYAETENAIYGWITNDAAIGHGYHRGVKQPPGTRHILPTLLEDAPEVSWCCYTSFHNTEELNDRRDQELAKVVHAMRQAAGMLDAGSH